MPVDASALEQRLREMAVEEADKLADRVVEIAQSRCSRRTGTLADSISNEGAVSTGNGATAHVVVGEDYGKYQDEGTGIYGPEGTRIEGNPLLAFDWPAAGGLVIVHSVAGSPGTHFWTDTVNDWPSIVASA